MKINIHLFSFKTKVLLKFIIALVFLVLATLFLTPKVNAEVIGIPDGASTITADSYSYYTNFPGDSTQVNESSFYVNKNVQSYYTRLSLCTGSNCFNGNFAPTYQYLGVTRGSGLTSIFNYARFKYTPSSSYCLNETTDLKSINFRFEIGYPDNYWFNQSYSYFGLTDNWNTDLNGFRYKGLNVRMIAHSVVNEEEYLFSTSCVNSNSIANGGNNFGGVLVTCNNVFNGNSNYPVDYYYIEVGNGIPFSNIYNSSNDSKYLISAITIAVPNNNSYQNRATFDYECSDNEPVINEPLPTSPLTTELDDIYTNIIDNYNSDIIGINTGNLFLGYPESFVNIVLMPINLIQSIAEASSTCSPYSIDFSSIVSTWGNSNSTYTLTLPCMRTTLSNLLGSTFYNLLDLFLSFFVFYVICKHIILYVEAITSGEDLFTLFFENNSSIAKNNRKE